ncbi:MAG: hypothetical protein GC178_09415 [Flavobacteriales bacterium]|nr:hypothetical protein [Flavobacteriales bacterium]
MKNVSFSFMALAAVIFIAGCGQENRLADTKSACESGHKVDLSKSGSSIHINKKMMEVTDNGVTCDCDLAIGITIQVKGNIVTLSEFKKKTTSESVKIDTKEDVFIAGMKKSGGSNELRFIGIDDVRGASALIKKAALEGDSLDTKASYVPAGQEFIFSTDSAALQFESPDTYIAYSKSGIGKAYLHTGDPKDFPTPKDAEYHYIKKVFY